MDDTLRKDFVSLNRKYLYLVRQLATDMRAASVVGLESAVVERIGAMSIDELDLLAEDMTVPCFKFNKTMLDVFVRSDKSSRRAFLTNLLMSD